MRRDSRDRQQNDQLATPVQPAGQSTAADGNFASLFAADAHRDQRYGRCTHRATDQISQRADCLRGTELGVHFQGAPPDVLRWCQLPDSDSEGLWKVVSQENLLGGLITRPAAVASHYHEHQRRRDTGQQFPTPAADGGGRIIIGEQQPATVDAETALSSRVGATHGSGTKGFGKEQQKVENKDRSMVTEGGSTVVMVSRQTQAGSSCLPGSGKLVAPSSPLSGDSKRKSESLDKRGSLERPDGGARVVDRKKELGKRNRGPWPLWAPLAAVCEAAAKPQAAELHRAVSTLMEAATAELRQRQGGEQLESDEEWERDDRAAACCFLTFAKMLYFNHSVVGQILAAPSLAGAPFVDLWLQHILDIVESPRQTIQFVKIEEELRGPRLRGKSSQEIAQILLVALDLIGGLLENAEELLGEKGFVWSFASRCMAAHDAVEDQNFRRKFIRMTLIFLQRLLDSEKLFPDPAFILEAKQFCVECTKVREASALFKKLTKLAGSL